MSYNGIRALELLRIASGRSDARFREGQEEAIRYVVNGEGRLLVVQKTGWGKSFVYFIATKLLREQGAGPALLISSVIADAEPDHGSATNGSSRRNDQFGQHGRLARDRAKVSA